MNQVLGRDAEAAGRDLLDLRVLLGAVARRILAALAGVGAGAEAVHRDRERLVRLRRQRAERHAGAVEAREDRLDRLDLVERDRRRARVERKAGRAGTTPAAR